MVLGVAGLGFVTVGCDSGGGTEEATPCPVGAEGCDCTNGGTCDAGLTCEAGRCMAETCPPGRLDCPCTEGNACDDGLECVAESCVVPECTPGSAGCECDANGGCDEGLDCAGDICAPPACPVGADGCPCDDMAVCMDGLICAGGICGTRPCPTGTPGCPCGVEGSCGHSMTCQSGLCDVPTCPAGEVGCLCRANDGCDTSLYCDNGICRSIPASTCGNGVIEGLEMCDDGNLVTERCEYGVKECSVCDRDCNRVWGESEYCGDGIRQAHHGEACDSPGAQCNYGQQTCQVCGGNCSFVTVTGPYCGDGIVQTQEACDGEAWCNNNCTGQWGTAYENNDDPSEATPLETDAAGSTFSNPVDGPFSHPTDVVEGPYAFVNNTFYDEDPDYFKITVCPGATLTARITFTNAAGNLDLLVGTRGTATSPGVIPPVYFDTISDSLSANAEEVAVTNNDGVKRIYYIKVEVYDDAVPPVINSYDLSGTLSGCN